MKKNIITKSKMIEVRHKNFVLVDNKLNVMRFKNIQAAKAELRKMGENPNDPAIQYVSFDTRKEKNEND